jgi:hypothetical protein
MLSSISKGRTRAGLRDGCGAIPAVSVRNGDGQTDRTMPVIPVPDNG